MKVHLLASSYCSGYELGRGCIIGSVGIQGLVAGTPGTSGSAGQLQPAVLQIKAKLALRRL